MTTVFMEKENQWEPKEGTIAGLGTVMEVLDEIEKECQDFNLTKDQLQFVLVKEDPKNSGSDSIHLVIGKESYFMRYHSLNQLVNAMKGQLRGAYIWQCLMYNKGQLAIDNLLAWELYQKEAFFIRTYQDEVRGFLSNRYTDFQNKQLIDLIREVLLEMDSIFVVSDYMVSEDYMSVYLKEETALFRDFKLGFKFSNSEVGLSAININLFIKAPKSNIVLKGQGTKFVSQKHVGNADLKLRIKQYLKQIKQFAKHIQGLLQSSSVEMIDIAEETKKIMEAYKLSKEKESKLNLAIMQDTPKSKLDFAQTLSSLAQLFPSLKEEFEVMAGDYLSGTIKVSSKK